MYKGAQDGPGTWYMHSGCMVDAWWMRGCMVECRDAGGTQVGVDETAGRARVVGTCCVHGGCVVVRGRCMVMLQEAGSTWAGMKETAGGARWVGKGWRG